MTVTAWGWGGQSRREGRKPRSWRTEDEDLGHSQRMGQGEEEREDGRHVERVKVEIA